MGFVGDQRHWSTLGPRRLSRVTFKNPIRSVGGNPDAFTDEMTGPAHLRCFAIDGKQLSAARARTLTRDPSQTKLAHCGSAPQNAWRLGRGLRLTEFEEGHSPRRRRPSRGLYCWTIAARIAVRLRKVADRGGPYSPISYSESGAPGRNRTCCLAVRSSTHPRSGPEFRIRQMPLSAAFYRLLSPQLLYGTRASLSDCRPSHCKAARRGRAASLVTYRPPRSRWRTVHVLAVNSFAGPDLGTIVLREDWADQLAT